MTDDAIREAVASAIEERIRSGAASPWITTLSQELASVATFAYETAQAKVAAPLSPADLVNALMATARANPHDANCIAMLDAVSDPMPPLGDSRRKAAAPADSEPSVEAREAAMAWYRALTERDDYVNYVHNLALRLDEFAARKVAEARAQERERCTQVALEVRREMLEEVALWHEKQAAAWQNQAVSAYRLAQSSDEADATEYRAQHETYTKYRIIHEHSARDLRALKV